MPVLYFAGLLLLRRQFRQEATAQHTALTSASDGSDDKLNKAQVSVREGETEEATMARS